MSFNYHFNAEDQAVLDSLRDKYRSAPEVESNHQQPPFKCDPSGSDVYRGECRSNALSFSPSHVCPSCQGLGLIQENYHFRVLERNCSSCDGAGIIFTKQQNDSSSKGGKHAPPNNDGASLATENVKNTALASRRGSSNNLNSHARLAIRDKIKVYQKEKDALQAGLEGMPNTELKALQSQVLKQLDMQIQKLQDMLDQNTSRPIAKMPLAAEGSANSSSQVRDQDKPCPERSCHSTVVSNDYRTVGEVRLAVEDVEVSKVSHANAPRARALRESKGVETDDDSDDGEVSGGGSGSWSDGEEGGQQEVGEEASRGVAVVEGDGGRGESRLESMELD